MSSEGISKKFEEIQSEIEKAITPYITIKVPMPKNVEKEEFLKLEKNEEFLKAIEKFTKRWLKRKGKKEKSSEIQVKH